MNHNLKLKIALLSCCFVTASTNAIAGNIPEMAKPFSSTPLYIIELITTIPSLFQMLAIMFGRFIAKKIGYKNNILLGIILCGIGGIIPIFIQEIMLILLSRAVFGIGVGLISSTLLTLIISFFDGETRSTMIGMQGSIGGLGSLIATFIAGQLLVFGWNYSFITYFVSFIVLIIVFLFVPNVKNEDIHENKETHQHTTKSFKDITGLVSLSLLMFLSVALATLFVIKCSSLVTQAGYGTAKDGSTIIMLISLGSLLSGAIYGKIYSKIKDMSLVLFYILCALAFVIGGMFNHLITMLIAGFILGFGYMAFVPFIQEKIHSVYAHFGESATSVVLVFQSLGAFLAPYLGNLFSYITTDLNSQFIMSGVVFGILALVAFFIKRPIQD